MTKNIYGHGSAGGSWDCGESREDWEGVVTKKIHGHRSSREWWD